MVGDSLRTELFFDLVYSLTDSTEEEEILSKNIPLYLRKLNCFMACVFKNKGKELEAKFILPHSIRANRDWDFYMEQLLNNLPNEEEKCKEGIHRGLCYYAFYLDKYGYLVLARRKAFDFAFKNELLSIVSFLGRSLVQSIESKLLQESENQLRRERNMLRTIINNIPINVYAKDIELRKTLCNKAELDYFNVVDERLILGKTDEELFEKEVARISFEEDKKVIEKGESIINLKKHYVSVKGEHKTALISKLPLLDENNQISGIVGITIDITEREKSERKLQQQEEKYRNIISNMNLGLLEVDQEDRILFCNHSFEDISGYSVEELEGQKAAELLIVGEHKRTIEKKNVLRTIGTSDSYEVLGRNKRGEMRWWMISGAPNYNDSGEITGSIGIHLDITEQRRLQDRLEQALISAQKASKAKAVFLSNMSHEIRTPLNGIVGMIRQMKKGQLDEPQRNYLHSASKATQHLLSIVNNILDITKIEAEELQIENKHFNLEELLRDVHAILQAQAEEKRLHLNLHIEESPTSIFIGDPTRIRQVLINLVGNALKFTEKGEVNIKCSSVTIGNNRHSIQFFIKDTGVGMDEPFLQKIFNKFQQEDATISRKFGGTGLGMFITKELIDLMNGSIEIKSKKGVGTEVMVSFDLPIGNSGMIDATIVEREDISLNRAKVLLVEDNKMNRLVARNTLALLDVEIVEAKNGKQALEYLKQDHFDLILMDIQMPIMDGMRATEIIRKEMHIRVPIIALSANAFKSEIDACRRLGMNDYIVKPFDENQFIKTILKYHPTKSRQASNNVRNESKSKTQSILYDLSKLKEMSRGNKKFIQKMLRLFIELTPKSIENLSNALKANDLVSIKKIAHKLKPSIDHLNISSIKTAIRSLESDSISHQSRTELGDLVHFVITTLEQSIAQIKQRELE
ncbi:MAG: response regulator [Bacteroidota bacterium]